MGGRRGGGQRQVAGEGEGPGAAWDLAHVRAEDQASAEAEGGQACLFRSIRKRWPRGGAEASCRQACNRLSVATGRSGNRRRSGR